MPRKRSKGKKKQKQREDEKLWPLRGILDERVSKGKIEYLIDWEDDPDTGKPFDHEWIQSDCVTETAIAEWEAHKTSRASSAAPLTSDQFPTPAELETEPAPKAPYDSDDSQPPRPANWRQLHRVQSAHTKTGKRQANAEDSEDEPLAKKQRLDYAPSPSQEPVPSIASSASFPSAASYDIPEEAFPPISGPSRLTLTVELNEPNFDISEYHSVQASQSSFYSSQPVSELESQDRRITLASHTSQKTIPDSQGTSDPSSLGGHNILDTTQSSHHVLQQHTVPDSQSQLADQTQSEEASHTLAHHKSTWSSVPEEVIPDSTGANTDIPSRQLIHQFGINDSSGRGQFGEPETGSVETPKTTSESQSRQLSVSDRVDFAEQETRKQIQEHHSATLSQSLPQEVASVGEELQARVSHSGTQSLSELNRRESGFFSNTTPRHSEAEEVHATYLDSPPQRQVQTCDDLASEAEIQDAQQRSSGSQNQVISEASQSPLLSSTSPGVCAEVVSERNDPKDTGISSREARRSASYTQNEDSDQLEQPGTQESISSGTLPGGIQSDRSENQKVEPGLGLPQAVEHALSNTPHPHPEDPCEEAPTLESRGGTQAPFLTQPDFPKSHSGLSSVHQFPIQTPAAQDCQSSSKHADPTRSVPEYSPGLLYSLCGDSQNYTAMLGPEHDQETTDRPSALAQMRAIWSEGPGNTEKKDGFGGNGPPMSAAPALSSSYHSVPMAGPSGQGFFSQLTTDGHSWAAKESSNLATGGAVPSASSEMRKILSGGYSEMPDAQPATVSPADVSLPSEAERLTLPVLPSHDITGSYSGTGQFTHPDQPQETEEDASSPSEPEAIDSYLVTLPFPSNIRDQYYKAMAEYKTAVSAFGNVFAVENPIEPEPALSAAISNLFADLRNFCDYPENALDMQDFPLEQKVRYYMDANAKLNFLYELLQGITEETKMLIVARSLDILRLICNVAEALRLEFVCPDLEHSVANPASHLHLTLSLNTSAVEPSQYDVVVSYDSVSSDSDMMKRLALGSRTEQQPLVLRLAIAFTIEHVEAEIASSEAAPIRKAGVLASTVSARYLVRSPPPLPKPHEVAMVFSEYINGTTESLRWEPEPLPPVVLDIYASQTTQTQRETSADSETAGRKRKPDEDLDAESKRLRVETQLDVPLLSDLVQATLREAGFTNIDTSKAPKERQLSVPLEVVETLAQKYSEFQRAAAAAEDLEPRYRAQIDSLQQQVKDFTKSQEMTYKRFHEATADRTQFEAKANKAVAELNQFKDAAKREQDKSQQKIDELEAVISRLTQDSAVAANEKALKEALEKNRTLEKRLETSHATEAYTRELYQTVSNSVHATNTECKQLRERNAELEKMTTENMLKAQQEQSKNSSKAHLAKIAELQTCLRETQIELDRVREDNKGLRNGRRETRQVSVPCSPRIGALMSPRPRAAYGGPASRAGSPAAPVMGAFDGAPVPSQFSTPSGNGRFVRR